MQTATVFAIVTVTLVVIAVTMAVFLTISRRSPMKERLGYLLVLVFTTAGAHILVGHTEPELSEGIKNTIAAWLVF